MHLLFDSPERQISRFARDDRQETLSAIEETSQCEAAAGNARRLRGCKVAPSLSRKNSAFALVAVLCAKGLSLVLVTRERFFDDFGRSVGRPDIIHLDLLAFQLLVVLEEALQNE
jgi:hypothetical protein